MRCDVLKLAIILSYAYIQSIAFFCCYLCVAPVNIYMQHVHNLNLHLIDIINSMSSFLQSFI